jgi:NADPH:quinone reductase-like Zn-dependent oxidoreductase
LKTYFYSKSTHKTLKSIVISTKKKKNCLHTIIHYLKRRMRRYDYSLNHKLLKKSMKALVLVAKDQPLSYQSVEKPVAGAGEVIVKLHAAALNHRDVWISKGQYAGLKYPTILGSDGAGATEDGRDVLVHPNMNWGNDPRFQGKTHQILGLPTDGTFAEYVKVGAEYVSPKPAHLTFEQAAALPLAGLTAYRALFSRCQAQVGERVLISGIGGGVALYAMQFALAQGCEVWVTSSSETKIQKAVEMGAKGGVNYKTENWSKAFMAKTGGFDVIIDSAAGSGFGELVKVCNSGARICFFGGTAGPISGVSPQIVFFKQLTIMGSTMGSPIEFEAMVRFVEKHKIVPVIDAVYPLSEGNAACERMDKGQQFGKIVLKIN